MTEPSTPPPTQPPLSTSAGEPGAKRAKRRRQITPRDVVGIVVAVLMVIFVVENGHRSTIRFVGPKVHTYLWLALLVAAAFGFVLGFAVAWQRGRSTAKSGKAGR
jgi:uncharacterized integral membrane protein